MKRRYTYNTEVPVCEVDKADQSCYESSDDEVSNCSSIYYVEEAWDLRETASHGTKSSYEHQSTTSDIEEASLSSSHIKASNEEENDKVGSLDKKLSKQYPTISLSSQQTIVSDITDADCFSFVGNGANLQKEIDALKYLVSKSKYFSSKEISKRLERLEEVSSQRKRETESPHTTREDSQRTRDTESSERARDTESIAKKIKIKRRRPRKLRNQRPEKALSTSLLELSPRDDFEEVKKKPSRKLSLPTKFLEEGDENPSKSKYFSSKEMSKPLERLEEVSSQRTRETESPHTGEDSQRTRDTESSERTRDTESIAKKTKIKRRRPRKLRNQRPEKALSTSLLEESSAPGDHLFEDVRKPPRKLSLPTEFLEEGDEKPSRSIRKSSRKKSRPSSTSTNQAGEIVEEFAYQPRPSNTVEVKNDKSTSKPKKNGNDPKKKQRKSRLTGRGNLWGSMLPFPHRQGL